MVFLITFLLGVGVIIPIFVVVVFAGMSLAVSVFGRISSLPKQVLAWIAFFASVTAISIPTVFVILPWLPDNREAGDGGVGMAKNAVGTVATWLLCPSVIMVGLSGVLQQTIGRSKDNSD